MKHFITRFILLIIVFLSYSGYAGGWTKVQIRGNFEGAWDKPYMATMQPNSDTNVWWLYIDFSNVASGDYYFKVLAEDNQWTGGNGGSVNVAGGNGYVTYDTANNTNGDDIKFVHDNKYRAYLFKITWWDNSHWRIEVWAAATIELRDYANVVYTKSDGTTENRNITGIGGYKYFCTWSDRLAWKKPSNVDVFAVSTYTPATDNSQASIQLTKLNLSYIPANVGLILAVNSTMDESITLERGATGNNTSFNLLHEQVAVYNTDQMATYNGTSLLKTCYDATALPRFEMVDGTECANYLFGFYRSTKAGITGAEENDFALGFWLSNGSGNTYANSAYLQIPKAEAELMGVGTSYDFTESSSAAPCFLIDFGEFDEATPTGIHEVSSLNDKGQTNNDDGLWYTLDGRKVFNSHSLLPKGIYIRNGKKYIIK